jgi:hypothetical protein
MTKAESIRNGLSCATIALSQIAHVFPIFQKIYQEIAIAMHCHVCLLRTKDIGNIFIFMFAIPFKDDHSRVVLQETNESDYINASAIVSITK